MYVTHTAHIIALLFYIIKLVLNNQQLLHECLMTGCLIGDYAGQSQNDRSHAERGSAGT